MASELARLFVTIGANTDEFKKGMQGITGTLKGIGTGMAVAGGLAAGLGGALFSIAAKSAATADNLEEMGQRTGYSTTFLQELGYAAKLSGTNLEGLEVGAKRMAVVLNDAATGSATAQKDLAALGLTVGDLQGLSPDQQFLKLASAIADVNDPIQKAALAVSIFGRSGTDMLPMLAGGAQGLTDMRKEANDLGIVMGEDAVKQGASFNDALDKIQAQFGGLVNQIGADLIPSLRPLIDAFSELVKALPIKEIGELLSELLPPLVTMMVELMKSLPIKEILQLVTFALKPLFSILTLVMTILDPIIKLLTFLINVISVALKPIFDMISGIAEGISGIFGGAFKGFKLPSFQYGGIVPGAIGEPQLALVHGGEMITPPGASGITNNFSISQLIVREEADIQRIARELYRMQQVRYG